MTNPSAGYPDTKIRQPESASLDWDDLRLLLAVVKTGSFRRTATTLGLTQPTISRRMARLEETIGAQLVDRSKNGVVLTREGQRIVEELQIAHGAIHRAIGKARSPLQRSQDVKLVTTDGLAVYWLSYFLPYLFDRNPELELRVFTASDPETDRRGHFDLSIHFFQPNDPNLITTRLGALHFIPFASPAYLAKHGRPRTTVELGQHRLLDYILYLIDKGSWMTRLPDSIEQVRSSLFTNSTAALAEAVRKGAGIALLPTYGLVFENGFVPLDVGLRFMTPFWVCYRQEALEKQPVRNVIGFLKHIFDRRTMPWFADHYVSPATFKNLTPEQVMASFAWPNVDAGSDGALAQEI